MKILQSVMMIQGLFVNKIGPISLLIKKTDQQR
jgi:hypothetical protein